VVLVQPITAAISLQPQEVLELPQRAAAALLVFHPPTTMQLLAQMALHLALGAAVAVAQLSWVQAVTAATVGLLLAAAAAAMAEAPYQAAAALVATDSAVFTLGKDKT